MQRLLLETSLAKSLQAGEFWNLVTEYDPDSTQHPNEVLQVSQDTIPSERIRREGRELSPVIRHDSPAGRGGRLELVREGWVPQVLDRKADWGATRRAYVG